MGPKLCLQRFLGRGKGKVANIQLHRAQLQNTEPTSSVAGLAEAGTSEIGCTNFRNVLTPYKVTKPIGKKKHTTSQYIERFHKGLTNLDENADQRRSKSRRTD
jgi:hypothetical protein